MCVCVCVKMGEGHTHSLIKEVRKYLSALNEGEGAAGCRKRVCISVDYVSNNLKVFKRIQGAKGARRRAQESKQQMNSTGCRV